MKDTCQVLAITVNHIAGFASSIDNTEYILQGETGSSSMAKAGVSRFYCPDAPRPVSQIGSPNGSALVQNIGDWEGYNFTDQRKKRRMIPRIPAVACGT